VEGSLWKGQGTCSPVSVCWKSLQLTQQLSLLLQDASMPTEGVLCLRMALEAGDHLPQDGGKKRASSNVDGGKVMCLRNVTNICCHVGPLR
jgi:hypothetical protein